jgi:hypothetical protein
MAKAAFPVLKHYDGMDGMLKVLARYGRPTPSKWTIHSWLYVLKAIPDEHRWCLCLDLQDRGIYFHATDFERPL